MAREKEIYFKHQFEQTYDMWSDLSDQEIESVEGVCISEKFSSYRTIKIDMRYNAHEAIRQLEKLAKPAVPTAKESRSIQARWLQSPEGIMKINQWIKHKYGRWLRIKLNHRAAEQDISVVRREPLPPIDDYKINSIKCPKENGGCGRDDTWRVALDRQAERFILDCTSCGYRHSFPLDVSKLTQYFTGPVDESGEAIRR